MPLSLSNRDQNSGHLFYNRRLRAATTRFSVRMKHDDRKQTAALALSMVLVAIAAGWMMLLNVLKPTGIVGDSAIIGDRDSGALYARIDGRLYPALNLTSARLATGTAGQPTWVKPAEIAKYPNEAELLHGCITAVKESVLKAYPSHELTAVGDWMLLAAIEALIDEQDYLANYHLAWYAVTTRRGGSRGFAA